MKTLAKAVIEPVQAILFAFTPLVLAGCAGDRASPPPAVSAPKDSGTPRPYNATLREFQDPSAAR